MVFPLAAIAGIAGSTGAGAGVASAGTAAASGGALSSIFGRLGQNIRDVDAKVKQSLNVAENIGFSIQPNLPSINPNLQAQLDSTFSSKLPELPSEVIDPEAFAKFIKQFAGEEEETSTKKKKKTGDTKDKKSSTPTQGANKPVAEATKSRAEGRSFFEQFFLDLVNGQLDVKLGG